MAAGKSTDKNDDRKRQPAERTHAHHFPHHTSNLSAVGSFHSFIVTVLLSHSLSESCGLTANPKQGTWLLRRFGDAIDLGAQTVQRPLDLLVRRVLMEDLEELKPIGGANAADRTRAGTSGGLPARA